MTLRGSFARVVAASAVVLALSLSGCAPQQPGYEQTVVERLQSQVLAVSTSSAGADYAAALVRLDELVVKLKDALAREQISQSRYESIAAAAALVRLDLEAAIATQNPTPSNNGGADTGKTDNPNRKDKDD